MKSAICLICCTLAVIGAVHAQPDLSSEALPGQETCTDLNGSWEMISMTVTTPDSVYTQDESEVPTLKILNDTHWMFIRQSAQEFVFAQGGTYRLEDGVYTEIVGYSAEPGNIGSEYVFECRLEGDSLWHHKGDLGSMFVDEVWRRVGEQKKGM